MEKWTSNAEWPSEIKLGINHNVSTDTHFIEEEARAVCSHLERNGFGGDEKVFPIRTWVAKVDS